MKKSAASKQEKIKKDLKKGIQQSVIAKKYSVTEARVSQISQTIPELKNHINIRSYDQQNLTHKLRSYEVDIGGAFKTKEWVVLAALVAKPFPYADEEKTLFEKHKFAKAVWTEMLYKDVQCKTFFDNLRSCQCNNDVNETLKKLEEFLENFKNKWKRTYRLVLITSQKLDQLFESPPISRLNDTWIHKVTPRINDAIDYFENWLWSMRLRYNSPAFLPSIENISSCTKRFLNYAWTRDDPFALDSLKYRGITNGIFNYYQYIFDPIPKLINRMPYESFLSLRLSEFRPSIKSMSSDSFKDLSEEAFPDEAIVRIAPGIRFLLTLNPENISKLHGKDLRTTGLFQEGFISDGLTALTGVREHARISDSSEISEKSKGFLIHLLPRHRMMPESDYPNKYLISYFEKHLKQGHSPNFVTGHSSKAYGDALVFCHSDLLLHLYQSISSGIIEDLITRSLCRQEELQQIYPNEKWFYETQRISPQFISCFMGSDILEESSKELLNLPQNIKSKQCGRLLDRILGSKNTQGAFNAYYSVLTNLDPTFLLYISTYSIDEADFKHKSDARNSLNSAIDKWCSLVQEKLITEFARKNPKKILWAYAKCYGNVDLQEIVHLKIREFSEKQRNIARRALENAAELISEKYPPIPIVIVSFKELKKQFLHYARAWREKELFELREKRRKDIGFFGEVDKETAREFQIQERKDRNMGNDNDQNFGDDHEFH